MFLATVRPQANPSTPDMAFPFGEDAAVKSCDGEEGVPRGQRVLSDLSGVRATMQSNVSNTVSVEIRISKTETIS
jgi:hypothetical protein